MKNNEQEIEIDYILELIKNTPNDYDLGKIIRYQYSRKNKKEKDIYNKK
jgi:hypothetical protein